MGRRGKEKIPFTRRELEILAYLQSHSPRPVPRTELLKEVWGYPNPESMETRTVDIHVAKLRKKIEVNPLDPEWLVTVRGEGYRLSGAK
jgi:two-component system response regulator RegX3